MYPFYYALILIDWGGGGGGMEFLPCLFVSLQKTLTLAVTFE